MPIVGDADGMWGIFTDIRDAVQVKPETLAEVQVSDDNRSAVFDFKAAPPTFRGHDDVLYEMGLHLPAAAANPPEGRAPLPMRGAAAPAPRPDSALNALSLLVFLHMYHVELSQRHEHHPAVLPCTLKQSSW